MSTPERCLKCEWWNFGKSRCDRIFKARIRVAIDAGEINIETQPGLLPKDLEDDFTAWLVTALGDFIDAWPGWNEIKRIRDGGKSCAGEKPCASIKEFGKLSVVKGVAEPLKNLDERGLFKSDISPW